MSDYQFKGFSKSYIRALLMDGYISYGFRYKGEFYWANVSIYDYRVEVVRLDLRSVSIFRECSVMKFLKSTDIISEHNKNCVKVENDGYDDDLFRYSLLLERALREGRLDKSEINDIDTLGLLEDIVIDSLERDVVAETTALMNEVGFNISPASIYGAMMYSGKVSPFLEGEGSGSSQAFKNTDKENMDELIAFMESQEEGDE